MAKLNQIKFLVCELNINSNKKSSVVEKKTTSEDFFIATELRESL